MTGFVTLQRAYQKHLLDCGKQKGFQGRIQSGHGATKSSSSIVPSSSHSVVKYTCNSDCARQLPARQFHRGIEGQEANVSLIRYATVAQLQSMLHASRPYGPLKLRSTDASILVVVVGDTRTILADGRKSVPLVEFLFLRLASWIENWAFGLGGGANGVTTVRSKPVRGRVVLSIDEPHSHRFGFNSVSDNSPWSDCPKRQHRSCSTGSEHETPGS